MNFLDELNPSQYDAVTNINGPVMIIAGPGSGKTRVLTYRIAHLMQQGIDSFRILALTFTNKSSAEMRERIEHIVGREARNLYMGTFHSVFARILRAEGHRLGFPNNFVIYDTDDAKSLLKTIIKEEGLNDKIYKPSTVYFRISNAKNELIDAEKYAKNVNFLAEDESSAKPKIAELYQKYTYRCFKAGAMDFDDLLLKMYELLEKFPDVLYKYQNRFSHVLIDEFQDTNFAQYEIVKRLSAINENICIVGDDAQSIYGFRGATIQNILNFERDYPDLKIFKLEQNYRSTNHIVNAANEVIKNNQNQLAKTIFTENNNGEKIRVFRTTSDSEEAKMVADNIFELKIRHYLRNQDFVILYRTNAQSRSFEESLRRLNIPYRIYGGLSFYQRKEIKDFIAYLRVVINPNDEEAIKRIINFPTRGIGQNTIDKLVVAASEHNIPLWHVVEHPEIINETQARSKQSVKNFAMMIKSFQTQLSTKNAYEIAELIGKQSGLIEDLYKDKSVEGLSRYENIMELLNGIKEYTVGEKPTYEEDEVPPENDLAAYLQQISLLTDFDNDKDGDNDKVKLMTIHAAKGLEFPCVFVVGLEENLFPSILSLNSREDLEEERRLFYVAITRAKKFLILSYALMRYKFGQLNHCDASRFIEEISAENVTYYGKPKEQTKPINNNFDTNAKWYMNKNNQNTNTVKKPEPIATPTNTSNLTNARNAIASKASIDTDLKNLQVGMLVLHEKFEKGKVTAIDGTGENKIATVLFNTAGQKKIMLKFAKLQILNS